MKGFDNMKTKRIIWSNIDIDLDMYQDFLDECYPNIENEYDKYMICNDINNDYLEDERINLDISCDEIIAIADLGLWNGRRTGYKIIGNNVKDILYSDCDFCEWYADAYNIKSKMIHHDGTNYIIYRMLKNNLSIEQKDNFFDALYNGRCNNRMLSYYTQSILPLVKKVYGW